jgi:hypothetical protein
MLTMLVPRLTSSKLNNMVALFGGRQIINTKV